MQWADLRGLSSSTRRVARMNNTATRRQLPLLLLSPSRAASVSTPSRWLRNDARLFTAGALLREDKDNDRDSGDKKNAKQMRRKQTGPSIYEEIFPETGYSYRRPHTQKDEEDEEDVDVRYVTSIHVDKSEVSEYKALKQALYQKTKKEATSQIPKLLVRKPQTETSGKEKKDGPSLFDELFKSEEGPKANGAKDAAAHLIEDRSVDHNDLQAWIDTLPKEDGSASAEEKERPAMLILSNASTNLTESDFYRIGPQGQHLDGWSASIRKVMQTYDYNSLLPLDRYFILFDSYAAAASYQQEAQRRHTLARRALQSPVSALGPPHPDPDQVFTLAPPSQAPLGLHLYKLNRATESRLETFSVQGLLSITPDPPPRAGSQVIVSLEGGTLDHRSLSQWIRRDARDRNLGWPVQHMRAYFPMKVDRRRLVTDDEGAEQDGEWDDSAPALVDSEEQKPKDPTDETAKSGRFVLTFPDVHEARRFVRAWHRKELTRARGNSVVVNAYFVW